MTLPPGIPIIFLILGALAIGASELARLRRPTGILIITTLLSLAALWTVRSETPVTQIIAAWQPVSVFTVPLSFRVDHTAWLLALGLLLVLLAAALTWGAYPGRYRPAPRAVALLLVAAALTGIFASNLLTLAVAWGLLDLAFVTALLVRGGSEVGRRAASAIVVNTASTICVWIAALLIENQQGSLYWHLFKAPEDARAWLMAAAVLRVGLYPFHQWLPVELGNEPDRAVIIFIVPTVSGLALWVRMAIAQALPADSIVPLLAVLSLVIGSASSVAQFTTAQWTCPSSHCALTGSVGLLAAAGASSTQLTAATLNWMFINVSLFIARGLDRRQPYWSVGSLIALLSLAALPGTLGFVVQQGVVVAAVDQKQWLILLTIVVAQIGRDFSGTALASVVRHRERAGADRAQDRVGPGAGLRRAALADLCAVQKMLCLIYRHDRTVGADSTPSGCWRCSRRLVLGALLAWRGPLIDPRHERRRTIDLGARAAPGLGELGAVLSHRSAHRFAARRRRSV